MEDFITVYKQWLATRQGAAERELTAPQRMVLAKLDNAKKRAWNSLPEPRRYTIVKEMIAQDLLPKELITCIDVFGGRVVAI